jgi:hypothetical protein
MSDSRSARLWRWLWEPRFTMVDWVLYAVVLGVVQAAFNAWGP